MHVPALAAVGQGLLIDEHMVRGANGVTLSEEDRSSGGAYPPGRG